MTSTTVAMLYPGHAAEDDFELIESALTSATVGSPGPPKLPVVITDIDSDDHTVAAMRAVGEGDRLAAAAQRAIAEHQPSALMWACTSGSFLYGWTGAHDQVAALSEKFDLPVSSTSLAFAAACAELGIEKVAIAATYPEPVTVGFTEFLAGAGIEVLASTAHDIITASDAGVLDGDGLFDMVGKSDSADAQAILIPDTALHTVAWLTDLERAHGKPVLTANQVTAWYGLRLTGTQVAAAAMGTLFEDRRLQ